MTNFESWEMFDWSLYGMLVRKYRADLGYKRAEEFSDTIWRRTRVRISRDAVYRIEQGKQTPSADQFMAINLALFGSPFGGDAIRLCMAKEWKQIMDGEVDVIPFAWKVENAQALRDEFAGGGCLDAGFPGLGIDQTCHSESFKFYVHMIGETESLFADERDQDPEAK